MSVRASREAGLPILHRFWNRTVILCNLLTGSRVRVRVCKIGCLEDRVGIVTVIQSTPMMAPEQQTFILKLNTVLLNVRFNHPFGSLKALGSVHILRQQRGGGFHNADATVILTVCPNS